ncbi:hypothetical protein MASR2M47_46310 [Draconibacterium sp.]
MKKLQKIGMMAVLGLLLMTACKNSEDLSMTTIEGTYLGTLSVGGQKSASVQAGGSATAVVTKAGNGLVEVHCFGNELDTTFMLNYYENHDSIMVCLTGSNFEHTYGHMMGQGHMAGGMMGDKAKGETEWQHHMGDEHKAGDEHFGGFDMEKHSFGYRFKMMNGNAPYYLIFQGMKKE